MTRAEFSKATKRAARERSGGHCEAVGEVYGLPPGTRCNAELSYGAEYDHYPIRAADGGDNSLENCVAVCRRCHTHKTRTFDIPLAAKGKRIADKRAGITGPKRPMRTAGFNKPAPRVRDINEDA